MKTERGKISTKVDGGGATFWLVGWRIGLRKGCPQPNGADLDSCRTGWGFSILGIWLVQMLARLRFQVLHYDAEKNWAWFHARKFDKSEPVLGNPNFKPAV